MSLFWSYFRDTLRFPFILKGGALALLAEGAALLLDTVRDLILSLRDQFFSTLCEEANLVHFAKSRGIVRAPLEPDSSYFGRVRFAYLWWKQGGRVSGMRRVLISYFGFGDIEIINMRTVDAARWAEFKVIASVIGSNLMFTEEQIIWAINEIKRAGSKLAGIEYVYSIEGDVPVYSFGMTSAEIITVFPEAE